MLTHRCIPVVRRLEADPSGGMEGRRFNLAREDDIDGVLCRCEVAVEVGDPRESIFRSLRQAAGDREHLKGGLHTGRGNGDHWRRTLVTFAPKTGRCPLTAG